MINLSKLIFSILLFTIANFCFGQSGLLEEFDSIEKQNQSELSKKYDPNRNYENPLDLTLLKEYQQFSINYRKKVFNFQLVSSIIIFITVLIIVFSGLILSFLHFRQSLKTNSNNETELEIGKSGIKIKSSIIGIIILIISISFLYLYLTHVYEIKEINIR